MGIEQVKFRGRHYSWRAVFFLVTGSIAIVLLIILSILSAIRNETSFTFGVIGMVEAVVSLVGLIVSIVATRERDTYLSVPIAGMVVNGIAFILYVIVYVLGLV